MVSHSHACVVFVYQCLIGVQSLHDAVLYAACYQKSSIYGAARARRCELCPGYLHAELTLSVKAVIMAEMSDSALLTVISNDSRTLTRVCRIRHKQRSLPEAPHKSDEPKSCRPGAHTSPAGSAVRVA